MSIVDGKYIKASFAAPYVAHVELSRMWTEYGEIFDKISRNPDVIVVVLSSSLPKLFTAGLDMNALDAFARFETEPARRALQLRSFILAFQNAISATERCPYPVIAAVHGGCIGLGIDIISACDIRYGSSDSSYSIKEVDVGLAADIGTLARIGKITGNHSLSVELALTARTFSAPEALALGLLSRVVDGGRDAVIRAAIDLAQEIAGKSPVAVVGTKRLMLHARDNTVQDNLEYTATWNGVMVQAPDMRDTMVGMKSKTKPQYAPLVTKRGAKL
ncbi:ClpP/crotonase [Gloeophyllum trabeum ATCC 11539]|uniref:ClpP/crotonase n=1 Tax=Gloeophyllum trabeum (strain ATCC 11539 / FP-39264 / Madison 617) TaxID=670483 RepID=S7QPQ2_GLOTA|nr:ClpP/crotonase [Gloeophyllum trabeum ATCC 11539]EPQ61372.1 ClpP/crotonase [Gloeophyllum trabeum ATCC 11539]